MTASLLVFVPVALFALIGAFCFVGCVLNTHGTGVDPNKPDPDNPDPDPKPVPFTKYSDEDVIGNPSCVAYWPLNDSSGQNVAFDVGGKAKGNEHDGEYRSNVTHPGLFPCPVYTLDPAGPLDSAFAPGDLTLEVPGIVAGDTNPPYDDPDNRTAAMSVNGGFVIVQPNSVVNPSKFTVEAWALPAWDSMAAPAYRTIIDSRNQGGGLFFGFVIFVNENGNWEAQLGGTGNGSYAIVPGTTASLTDATYVALTCDGSKAKLFVNGEEKGSASLPAGSSFAPNTVKPLVIGVGVPYLDDRMNSVGDNFFPLLPFNGTIQCVAIYNAVLSDDDIKKHFDDGSGKTTVPAG
jgi:hypothetical protein